MSVTIDNLMDQLAEDETRKPQIQIYFDTATAWVKNAISSDDSDASFFATDSASTLYDLAILSYSMDLWTHRSDTIPPNTAVWHMVGQLRGLYSSWKEAQDGETVQTE